jgi:hypothetical protein
LSTGTTRAGKALLPVEVRIDAELLLYERPMGFPRLLSGERSWQLTRDYTAAFFDTHLRDMARPLLDGPVADRPEVGFPRM